MPRIKTRDGVELYAKDWGQGRPVILLHGWPLTGDTFDDLAIKLVEAGKRCIIPDRRGFGRPGGLEPPVRARSRSQACHPCRGRTGAPARNPDRPP